MNQVTKDVEKTTGHVARLVEMLGLPGMLCVILVIVLFYELEHLEEEVRNLVASVDRSIEHSNQRFETFQESQTVWHEETKDLLEDLISAMTASCYAAANGDPEARGYCDRIRQSRGD